MSWSPRCEGNPTAFVAFSSTRDTAFKVNPTSPAVSNLRLSMSALYRTTVGIKALQVSLQDSRVRPAAARTHTLPLRPRNASTPTSKPVLSKPTPEMLRKRYVVQERLGQGAFATLIRCKDTYENDKDVAIKVIAKGRTEIGLQELDHSLKLFRRLPSNQTHLVSRPHCSFFHGARLCMVFDLLGDTFEERFNIVSAKAQTPRRRAATAATQCMLKDPSGVFTCSVEGLRALAFQLTYGLFAMHSQGFIHGDLKPTNIMFKQKETKPCCAKRPGECTCLSADHWSAKLIDLGNVIVPSMLDLYTVTAEDLLCRASDMLYRRAHPGEDADPEDNEPIPNGDVRDGVHIASLSYRAPEVLTCLLPFSSAIDMWALGATLVEVRTGQRLFPPSHNMLQVVETVLGPTPYTTPVARCVRSPEAARNATPFTPAQTIARISELTGIADSDALSFLSGLLKLDPVTRLSSRDALCHPFLRPYASKLPLEVQAALRLSVVDQSFANSPALLSPVSIREGMVSPTVAVRAMGANPLKRNQVPVTITHPPAEGQNAVVEPKRPMKRLRC